MCGVLDAAITCDRLTVGPGAVAIWLAFIGGERPMFTRVELRGAIRDGDAQRQIATYEAGGPAAIGPLLDNLLDHLAEVTVEGAADPLGDVAITFSSGLEIVVPGEHPVRISGATEGPPEGPALSRPLEVEFGGEGLRLSHRHLRWLARQVPVAVARARLHPDGRVELEGSGGRLARLVQGGLDAAGEQLTELVRTAQAFERVRTFLRP